MAAVSAVKELLDSNGMYDAIDRLTDALNGQEPELLNHELSEIQISATSVFEEMSEVLRNFLRKNPILGSSLLTLTLNGGRQEACRFHTQEPPQR